MSNYLTPLQESYVRKYLKDTFYNSSPWLLMMDYYGNVWSVPTGCFKNFYDTSANKFFADANHYYKYSPSAYRFFDGWTINLSNGNDKSILELKACNLNSIPGYKTNCNGVNPRGGTTGNYFSEEDMAKFKSNEKTRIFPQQIGGDGSYERPPNSIPGYDRISQNPIAGTSKPHFDTGGFITIDAGFSKFDPAFVLFRCMDRDSFINDVLLYHPTLITNILNNLYSMKSINDCLSSMLYPSTNGLYKTCKKNLSENPNEFRHKYNDYVSGAVSRGSSDMCYSKLGDTIYANGDRESVLDNNDSIGVKYIDYCITNSNEISLNENCYKVLSPLTKLNDLYVKGLCNKGDNILTNKNCISLVDSDRITKHDGEKVYNKIINEDAMINWCNATNKFVKNATNWKYTENPYDPDCLNNWAYYEGNALKNPSIPNIVKPEKGKSWCPTRKFIESANNALDKDSKLAHNINRTCTYLQRKGNIINQKDDYKLLNDYWKSLGCIPDLPHNIYLKVFTLPFEDQKKFVKDYFNTYTLYSRNLCYTGDAIENGQHFMPGQCIYSQNKKFKLCMDVNGAINIFDLKKGTTTMLSAGIGKASTGLILTLQEDGDLVQYDSTKVIWKSDSGGNADKRLFGVMRNDGKFVLYTKDGVEFKILNKESYIDGVAETYDIYSWVILTILILAILVSSGYYVYKSTSIFLKKYEHTQVGLKYS